MKQKAINHEVLLLTGTSFSKKQFSPKNNSQADDFYCSDLQDACWNGLVFDILPDMIKSRDKRNPGYTCEVVPAENFIDVKIGVAPYDVEKGISLTHTSFFLKKISINHYYKIIL